MATNYNYFGNLVTSGLVLDLDAAKLASYPGTGTTWFDISGNGNNGTLTNGPTFTGIGKQAAIVFDGTDDYVLLSNTFMADAPAGTFDIWFNLSTTSGSSYSGVSNILIGKPSSPDNAFGFSPSTSKLMFRLGNVTNLTSSVSANTGSWQSAQGVWDSTKMSIYQNGSPVASVTVSGSTWYGGTSYNTVLGRNYTGQAAGSFTGQQGNVKIYNRSLSQFEIWQNFNAFKGRYGIPDIVTNGLVLNLDAGNPYSYLSGSSGTKWTNTVAVSSSISGTLVNGPVYANGAISFDGVDDECNIGNVLFNSASAATIDMWISIPSMSGGKYIAAKGSAGDGIYTFYMNTGPGPSGGLSSYIRFLMGNQSGSTSTIIEYGNLNFNQWYNFTFTYDGSFVRGYQNATSPQSSSLSGNLYTTTSPIQLASSKYGAQSACSFSNFKIYNRALSAAEITQNFNALRGRYGI